MFLVSKGNCTPFLFPLPGHGHAADDGKYRSTIADETRPTCENDYIAYDCKHESIAADVLIMTKVLHLQEVPYTPRLYAGNCA